MKALGKTVRVAGLGHAGRAPAGARGEYDPGRPDLARPAGEPVAPRARRAARRGGRGAAEKGSGVLRKLLMMCTYFRGVFKEVTHIRSVFDDVHLCIEVF